MNEFGKLKEVDAKIENLSTIPTSLTNITLKINQFINI